MHRDAGSSKHQHTTTTLQHIMQITEQICHRFEPQDPTPIEQAPKQSRARRKPNRNHIPQTKEERGAVA
jgi:hypothetical protein